MAVKGIISIIMLVAFAGCSSLDAVYKNYDSMVDVKDGVGAPEAKLIAQKDILRMQQKRDYRITAPDIKKTPEAMQYPEYWFVTFGHNWFSPISTDPMAKTYTQLRETQYVVVIDKKTGDIKFSGEWHIKRDRTFNWVFDPEGYKRESPLALPSWEKGIQEY